jgi:hypothetical protein
MISEYRAKKYCADDISLIENYDKAINDSAIWDCHHRDEIRVLPSGMIAIRSVSELKENVAIYSLHSVYFPCSKRMPARCNWRLVSLGSSLSKVRIFFSAQIQSLCFKQLLVS